MLAAFFCLGAWLRMHGDTSTPSNSADENEAWEAIKAEWPILITADSLLSLQAMLRLVLLVSAVLRAGTDEDETSPFAGFTSVLCLGATLARVLLVARTDAYQLDGPLGGVLPVVCEVLTLPLLLLLARRVATSAVLLTIPVMALAAWVASRNHLALSEDYLGNVYFSFAHIVELLAALACVLRTLIATTGAKCTRPSMSTGFLYVVLPVQQSMAAYYFLEAFTPVAALVGAGCPFELLQYGNAAALGAYVGALALFVVDVGEVQYS
eukprot:3890471-Amphidinium_carterae.1